MPANRLSLVLPLFVALAIFCLHLPDLNHTFHYDDGHSLQRNPHLRTLANLPRFFSDPRTFSENPDYAMYRPVLLVTYALDYAWSQDEPFGYLLVNLIIHCLASSTVYLLLRQLGFVRQSAFLTALLFGLHPVQSEPVNYISSRSESLAGLFFLAAFSTYLRTFSSSPSLAWYGVSLFSFALGILAKSTAIALPLLLLLHRQWLAQDRPALKWHLPYWLLAGLYLFIYQELAPQGLARAGQVRPWPSQLATQAKALIYYVRRAAMPIDLSVYPQFWPAVSPLELVPLLALLSVAALLGMAILLRRRHPLFALGLFWFPSTLLPVLVVPLHILVNDHRLYLAILGPCLILGHLAGQSGRHWPLGLLCLLFALLSYQRDRVWKDEITLWQDAVAKAPLMPETHYNLGHAYHLAGDLVRARQAYEQAVQLSPGYARAQVNLGVLYRQEGQLDQAEQALLAALRNQPDLVEALNNLGLVYGDQGRLEEAAAIFREALKLRPELAEVHFNLGLIYRDQGKDQQAFEHLNRALQLDPGLKDRFPQKVPPSSQK